MSNPYNGWANYETWLVSLWMDNEQSEQERWHERAKELLAEQDDAENGNVNIAYELSKEIKEAHEESYSEAMEKLSGVHVDMLRAAYSDVDWFRIARSFVESAVESLNFAG